jgi:hypothetical protein
VRDEQGGCLSSEWPNAEVTVQYIPQTRALEMTADCGLSGTRRIACKRNSEKVFIQNFRSGRDLHLCKSALNCVTQAKSH